MSDSQYHPQAEKGLEQAMEIIKALKEMYDGGNAGVYGGALLFEDDRTLAQHIDEAIANFDALPDPDWN